LYDSQPRNGIEAASAEKVKSRRPDSGFVFVAVANVGVNVGMKGKAGANAPAMLL